MFNINHNVIYYETNYITPSYILKKQNYLPKANYNLKNNNNTQLFLIYRELLRILNAIKIYITKANKDIDDDITNQLTLLRNEYPATQEKYATYCSTILSLIYKDGINFSDIVIQQIYENLKNKVIFTTTSQNIINELSIFINSKLSRYNYLVDKLNVATNNSYANLAITINPITENYLDIVEEYIGIYKNAINN
jgi:hypothetical protein